MAVRQQLVFLKWASYTVKQNCSWSALEYGPWPATIFHNDEWIVLKWSVIIICSKNCTANLVSKPPLNEEEIYFNSEQRPFGGASQGLVLLKSSEDQWRKYSEPTMDTEV